MQLKYPLIIGYFSKLLISVRNCSYLQETEVYSDNKVKRSKLLDEMAEKARAEVLRIETARLEAHRLLLRREAELLNSAPRKKRKSLITTNHLDGSQK